MRSKEQFKNYVYEKADATRKKNMCQHTAVVRGAVVFSLLVIVCGVFIYSNNSFFDSNILAPAAENEMRMEAVYDEYAPETIAPSVEYVWLMDEAATEENFERNVADSSASAIKTDDFTASHTDSVFYSYSSFCTQSVTVSTVSDFVVAEVASAYSGDLTGIDFSKNIALVITLQTEIKGWDIEYGNDVIIVTITSGEKSTNSTAYTVLLEKTKYSGQDITIFCK